jgi:hypothetical protein
MKFTGVISFIVFVVFLVLKLTQAIGWSWWWITSPLWIYAVLCAIVLVLAIVFANKIADWQVRKVERFFDALTCPPRRK